MRSQEVLPETSLLIAVSWGPAALLDPRGLQPVSVWQRGSAAANACFRLLKNQPRCYDLWPLCYTSQVPPPTFPPVPHTNLKAPSFFFPPGRLICTLSFTLPPVCDSLSALHLVCRCLLVKQKTETVSNLPCHACNRELTKKCFWWFQRCTSCWLICLSCSSTTALMGFCYRSCL